MSSVHIDTDKAKLQFDVIHGFISRTYWAKDIPAAVMRRAIDNSLCFGAYNQRDEQVAFARVTTDYATFAYLADVFVLQHYQGLGIGKALIAEVVAHPELQGLRRFMLATFDAHDLYRQFGFNAIDDPSILMQRHNADIYQA